VNGLITYLITSTIFAAIGTAVKGLLRPISWGVLGLALVLLIANRLTGAPGSDTGGLIEPPISPAREGWQQVARELEPVYSDTLADAQTPARSGNSNSGRRNTETDRPTAAPANASPSGSAGQNSAPSSTESSPSPIPAFW
jgi:hypothetical protein